MYKRQGTFQEGWWPRKKMRGPATTSSSLEQQAGGQLKVLHRTSYMFTYYRYRYRYRCVTQLPLEKHIDGVSWKLWCLFQRTTFKLEKCRDRQAGHLKVLQGFHMYVCMYTNVDKDDRNRVMKTQLRALWSLEAIESVTRPPRMCCITKTLKRAEKF